MYILKYSERNNELALLKERLQDMSLVFKLEYFSDLDTIVLSEGKKEIIGSEDINSYLDELNVELHQWYYCNC